MSDRSREVYGTGCSVNLGLGLSVCAIMVTISACCTVPERELEPLVTSVATNESEASAVKSRTSEGPPPLPTSGAVPVFPTLPSTRSAPATTLVHGGYGIQIHGCGYPVEPALDLVVDAGFGWVKQQVRWEELEPEFGNVDWRCIDEVVDRAAERDLKVLLSVTTSPQWSRQGQAGGAPEVLPLFGQFCLRLTERYKGRIHAIEVFNEPNLDIEWGDHLDPYAYYTLLSWAYSGIKQIDPDVVVISAGLAPTEWNDWATAIDDRDYLAYLAGGVGDEAMPADCIGMHFNHGVSSPLEPGGPFEAQVTDYHEAFGSQIPVCITEFGIATPDRTGGDIAEGFEWSADTTAAEQAEWLVDGLRWAERHRDIVPLVIIWNLNYHDDNTRNDNVLYALWSPWGMMPAYDSLKIWLHDR
jgi:GH35 family endo-1,4-beta-xylanase